MTENSENHDLRKQTLEMLLKLFSFDAETSLGEDGHTMADILKVVLDRELVLKNKMSGDIARINECIERIKDIISRI